MFNFDELQFIHFKILFLVTSLVVQWLSLQALNAGGLGLIPGQGAGSPFPISWLLCGHLWVSDFL